MEGGEHRRRRRKRRTVGECSSVIIPIVLLNFSQKDGEMEGGEHGEEKREDVTSYQEKNPTTPKS